MKWIVLAILLCLVACKEISFKQPQPKDVRALNTIPGSLRGKYLLVDPNTPIPDTLFVEADGYRVGHNPKEKNMLGDSLVLKNYKGYYFLNINGNPEWFLRVIKQEKNGDLQYMSLEQEQNDFGNFVKKLSTVINVDSVQLKDEILYQIDPTPRELVTLINKGYFKKITLKKIR